MRQKIILLAGIILNITSVAQMKENKPAINTKKEIKMDAINQQVCFIDKFLIPNNSVKEFTEKMNYNRRFIKTLEGFIRNETYRQIDSIGNLTLITIAVWKNQDYLNKAKSSVQAEFKKINFNPNEFYQRLSVTLERGLYEKSDE